MLRDLWLFQIFFSMLLRFFIVMASLGSVLGLDPPSYFMEDDDHVKQVYHTIGKFFYDLLT